MRLIIIYLTAISLKTFANQELLLSSFEGGYVNKISEVILEQAYSAIGYKLSISHMPAERALRESTEGRTDGEVNRTDAVSIMYPQLIKVPVILTYIDFKVLTKKNKKYDITNWQSLSKYCVASQIGVKMVDLKLKAEIHITKSNLEDAIKVVANGRCDLVVAEYYDLVGSLKKLNFNNLAIHEVVIERTPLYHYLHEKNKKIIPLITAQLEKMNVSGELDKLRSKVKSQLE